MNWPVCHLQASIGLMLYCASVGAAEAAWLKAYGPDRDAVGFNVRHSPLGDYHLTGVSNSREFLAKIDAKGRFKWGRLFQDPVRVETAPSNASPPYQHMFSVPASGNSQAFAWGKLRFNAKTGAIKRMFSKSMDTAIGGNFVLQGVAAPASSLHAGYVITGSLNSNWRGGPDVAGGDVVIAKVNAKTGALDWSRVLGTDLGGLKPSSDKVFPLVTQVGGTLYYSFSMNLLDGAAGANAVKLWSFIGRLNAKTGAMVGTPVIIDGINVSHASLPDGSVLAYSKAMNAATRQLDLVLVKLDKDLNFEWGKSYASASGELMDLSTGGNRTRRSGEIELTGSHFLNLATGENYPVAVRVGAADGAILAQKEWRLRASSALDILAPSTVKQPVTDFDLMQGSIESAQPGVRDIVFGKLDADLGTSWVRSIPGAAVSNGAVSSWRLLPNETRGSFRVWGITSAFGAGGDHLLLGQVDKHGNIPGCSYVQEEAPLEITPDILARNLDIGSRIRPAGVLQDQGSLPTGVKDYGGVNLRTKTYRLGATAVCGK